MGHGIRMQEAFWRHVVIPVGDRLFNQSVAHHLRYYEATQRWPWERIAEERDALIRNVVSEAYAKTSFYREAYDQAGVKPQDIKGYNDLPLLPIIDKDDLRKAYPQGVSIKTRSRAREYSTSGSTGRPFTVIVDDDTMSRARALMLLRTLYAGWRLGDPILQTGMAINRGILKGLKDRVFRVYYRSAYNLSAEVLDEYLDLIDCRKILHISGYAQSLYLLAIRAVETGFNKKLSSAVSWGSTLLPHYRESILRAFGCRTYDSYGVGEGMQIASQSTLSGDLYHQFCLHVAAEVVNDNVPARPGTRGEIILTRLNAGSMPLIRYRIGDIGRTADSPTTTNGINLPLWAGIDGRTSEIVVTPSGNHLIVEFFFGIMQNYPTIINFQVTQVTANHLQFLLEVDDRFCPEHWMSAANEILEKGDSTLTLDYSIVPSIPLEPTGKRRFIVPLPKNGRVDAPPSV